MPQTTQLLACMAGILVACLYPATASIDCQRTNGNSQLICAGGTVSGGSGASIDYSCKCSGNNTNASAVAWSWGFETNPGDTYVVYRTITTNQTAIDYDVSYFNNSRQEFWRGQEVESLDIMVALDNINMQLDANYVSNASSASAVFRFGFFGCGIHTTSQTPLVNIPSVISEGDNAIQVRHHAATLSRYAVSGLAFSLYSKLPTSLFKTSNNFTPRLPHNSSLLRSSLCSTPTPTTSNSKWTVPFGTYKSATPLPKMALTRSCPTTRLTQAV
jgi:hypothetical protein